MKAPEFELTDLLTHETYRLEDFIGKPIVLTFWVSWCPDCQRDLPKKVTLFNTMNKNQLHMLSINVTGRERASGAGEEFARDFALPFPVLADQDRMTYEAYHCTSVPTTVLIDQNGDIAGTFGDQASFEDILSTLTPLLND